MTYKLFIYISIILLAIQRVSKISEYANEAPSGTVILCHACYRFHARGCGCINKLILQSIKKKLSFQSVSDPRTLPPVPDPQPDPTPRPRPDPQLRPDPQPRPQPDSSPLPRPNPPRSVPLRPDPLRPDPLRPDPPRPDPPIGMPGSCPWIGRTAMTGKPVYIQGWLTLIIPTRKHRNHRF